MNFLVGGLSDSFGGTLRASFMGRLNLRPTSLPG